MGEHIVNNMTRIKEYSREYRMPANGLKPIPGVTYGGIMHRFINDQAVKAFCTAENGGYYGHTMLNDGSIWIPLDGGFDGPCNEVVQIGWTR